MLQLYIDQIDNFTSDYRLIHCAGEGKYNNLNDLLLEEPFMLFLRILPLFHFMVESKKKHSTGAWNPKDITTKRNLLYRDDYRRLRKNFGKKLSKYTASMYRFIIFIIVK